MSEILLSILIPTTPDRRHLLNNLYNQFDEQLNFSETKMQGYPGGYLKTSLYFYKPGQKVEVIEYEDDKTNSIGFKRNELMSRARGEYVAFIDSDDKISNDYFDLLFVGIEKGVDCCSLVGEITFDGKNPKPFIHSVKYDKYWEDEHAYYRYPNHLNCIKSSIAKKFRFPLTNHGEDTSFATQVFQARAITTEHEIPNTIYHYLYVSNK